MSDALVTLTVCLRLLLGFLFGRSSDTHLPGLASRSTIRSGLQVCLLLRRKLSATQCDLSRSASVDMDGITWSSSTSDLPIRYFTAVSHISIPNRMRLLMTYSPEVLRMSELNDSSELQKYSSAVLYILSAVPPPAEYVEIIADNFLTAITSSTVSLGCIRSVTLLILSQVVANSAACLTHIHCFLLSEPNEHVQQRRGESHGCSTGMPF